MRDTPKENGRAADQAKAGPDGSRSDSEVLTALAAAVEKNERAQERFRNAVVRKLARLEARARVLQLSNIVDSLTVGQPLRPAGERDARLEAVVLELSEDIERRMRNEISDDRGKRGAGARRAKRPGRSEWES
ncbi:MAG TPA: hypothetical protein VLT36_17520 [Candidatus Dormibacteraeota bacterium]|nr:hypothetical protein [Candidatus Dormibacteraeota bacterium]